MAHADRFTISLRPTDIVEGVLQLRRGAERRVLVLERMTAKEADVRLTEAKEDGWLPGKWLRQGPSRPVTAHLWFRRALA